MKFESIKEGHYIKFTAEVSDWWKCFPGSALWDGEPKECILYVTNRRNDTIDFDCVNACGCHGISSLDEQEVEDIENLLGEDLFLAASIQDAMEKDSGLSCEASFEDTILEIKNNLLSAA